LPPPEKDLLQTLAVIGKEFPFGLLRLVAEPDEEDLYRGLSHLQAGEFIYEQPAFPDPEYTFKHALTQEVAYQSLLGERRASLHERTAQAMETLHPDALEAHYGELAHHYGRSQNTVKAVEYLYLAGEQAVKRSAYAEAIRQLHRGVELVQTLPDTDEYARQELLLQFTLGQAFNVTRGYGSTEAEEAFLRTRELSVRVGDATQRFRSLWGLWSVHVARSELETAADLAEQLVAEAERTRDPAQLVLRHYAVAVPAQWRGEFLEAREHFEKLLESHDLQDYGQHEDIHFSSADPRVMAMGNLSILLATLGYPDQALRRSREGLARARELSHPFSEGYALGLAAAFQRGSGEAQAALKTAETLIALASEHGFMQLAGQGAFIRAAALVDLGQLEEAIAGIRGILNALRTTNLGMIVPVLFLTLAEAQGKAGAVEEGLESIAEAQTIMRTTGHRFVESMAHRVNGELLLARSPPDQAGAEASFREALEVARRQSTKSNELRAATSLARLCQQQGRKDEARGLLAPAYGWFTEGFDTRPLKEAKALLDELD
jgi:predicted ATPase